MHKKSAPRIGRIILAVMSAALALLPAVEAQRQPGRLLTVQEVKQLPAKAKRFALVIGVDEYQDSQISRLSGATNDAKALADALVRYAGFPQNQVILLASDQPQEHQPNRGNVLQYLSNLCGEVPKDGLLLVSFAGHGIDRGGHGFLCPLDARTGNMELLKSTAVDVDLIHGWIRNAGVEQVLIILDACRNDPTGRGNEQNKLTDSFAQKFNFNVRNQEVTAFATLYATDVGHVAYEYKEKKQGYFTWMLVEGLKGGAANERGEVTLGGLVKYLQEQVPKQVRLDLGQEKSQKPLVKMEGYKADELVISITVRITPDKPAVSSADAATIEVEFWKSISGSSDADDFREYLTQYPSGRFAGLARNKIRSLEAAAKPSVPAVNPPASNPTGTPPASSGAGKQENVDLQTYTETVNRVGIAMVRVPAGKFLMGSPDSETGRDKDESPQHEVSVSSFYMGKYEVTQLQWRAVSVLPKVKIDLPSNPAKFQGDNLPIEQVSWEEAVEFCERLSRATGKTYRLPTEAEWEYAARAMTTGPYAGNLDEMGWYGNNSGRVRVDADEIYRTDVSNYYKRVVTDNGAQTHGVGQKRANGFGLYDLHGNVLEWCMDWHSENYYAQSPSADPTGPSTGSGRVGRGGGWYFPARLLRSAARGGGAPGYRIPHLGFRLVRTYN